MKNSFFPARTSAIQVLCFSVLLVSSSAPANFCDRDYSDSFGNDPYFPAAEKVDDLSIESIKDYARTTDSVANFVGKFPSSIKKRPLFVHRSRGSESNLISRTNPRVILFSKNLDTIVSFNGISKKIETIQYDRKTKMFKFRLIDKSRNPPLIIEDEKSPEIQKCHGCHGSPPLPIIDSYSDWPGWYGSNDADDENQFKKFLEDPNRAEAYKKISLSPTLETHFANRKTYGRSSESLLTSLNLGLNQFLFEQITSNIRSNKKLKAFRFALLGITSECLHQNDLSSWGVPYSESLYKKMKDDVFSRKLNYSKYRSKMKGEIYGKQFELTDTEPTRTFVDLRYILSSRGTELRDWLLDFERNGDTFDDGLQGERILTCHFYGPKGLFDTKEDEEFFKKFPKPLNMYSPNFQKYCAELKKQSRKQLFADEHKEVQINSTIHAE